MEIPDLAFFRNDDAAAVDRRDDFHRIEAEGSDVAEASDFFAVDRRSEGVASVFYHAKPVPARELVNTVDIARYSREMKRNDRLGTRRDQLLGLLAVDSEIALDNVAHDDFRTGGRNGLVVGNVVERR